MKFVVCGSKEFDDPNLLAAVLAEVTMDIELAQVTVVTGAVAGKAKNGHLRGAEYQAEQWALRKGMTLLRYHTETAVEMLEGVEQVVAFGDYRQFDSRTKELLELAHKQEIDLLRW